MGKPFKTINTKRSTMEVFSLPPRGYMVFEYLKNKPHNIYSMQITGQVKPMLPFKGLVLGDSKTKVVGILGTPSKTKQLNKLKVEVLKYDNSNTSVEIDSNGHLYSIKASITNKIMSETDKKLDSWKEFKTAIRNKDTASIIDLLRPDVEIYIKGKTLKIEKRFDDFRSKPNKDFMSALIGEKHSLLEEISQSEAESEMRLIEEMGIGYVHKFYNGKIVKEVVFFPYDGKYRVYEIAFINN